MPFLSYGWPKRYAAGGGRFAPDVDEADVVHLGFHDGLLVRVSTYGIEVWKEDQTFIRVGEHFRDVDLIQEQGEYRCVTWCPLHKILLVTTTNNIIHTFRLSTSEEFVQPCYRTEASIVDVREGTSFGLPELGDDVSITALLGARKYVVVGTDTCDILVFTVQGRFLVRHTSLQDKVFAEEATKRLRGLVAISPRETEEVSMGHAIVQLDYCEDKNSLFVVLSDGRCAVIKGQDHGGDLQDDFVFGCWLADGSSCVQSSPSLQMLALGMTDGTVLIYDLNSVVTCTSESTPEALRNLTLEDWGLSGKDTGGVSSLAWSPDGAALAVGYRKRGMSVWSAVGCRLFCTLRRTGDMLIAGERSKQALASGDPLLMPSSSTYERFANGISRLAWSGNGFSLVAAEPFAPSSITQVVLVKAIHSYRTQCTTKASLILMGSDRLLLIHGEDEKSLEDGAEHLIVPNQYISLNWPLQCAAVSCTGQDYAVAGSRGLALYSNRLHKWRVFGDASQEKTFSCKHLLWMEKMVLASSEGAIDFPLERVRGGSSDKNSNQNKDHSHFIQIFPRYHLDIESRLAVYKLSKEPISIDACGRHILVLLPPMSLRLIEWSLEGDLVPASKPRVNMWAVRELSIVNIRSMPVCAAILPPLYGGMGNTGDTEGTNGTAPMMCTVLRQPGGELSLLDMERGSERTFSSGVQCFWLGCSNSTSGRRLLGAEDSQEMSNEGPIWAYSDRGMQLWYPSAIIAAVPPISPRADRVIPGDDDPELEFDKELYPIGLVHGLGCIVRLLQKHSASIAAEVPCWDIQPKVQPTLPCMLRHLLIKKNLPAAAALAHAHEHDPHFSFSLEWLLFTSLESERDRGAASAIRTKGEKQHSIQNGGAVDSMSLVESAIHILRPFRIFLDVIVSLARKTDSVDWPLLFSAAGNPSTLFQEAFSGGQLETAACFLVIIERFDGVGPAQARALRLLEAALGNKCYDLVGEILRFVNGRSKKEAESFTRDQNQTLLRFFMRSPGEDSVFASDAKLMSKKLLQEHASGLLRSVSLHELAELSRVTSLDLSEFLAGEGLRSAHLDNFLVTLESAYASLPPDQQQGRSDAQFLLPFFYEAGLFDWAVVLATICQDFDVLDSLLRPDAALWKAYKTALSGSSFSRLLSDFLSVLESKMDHSTIDA